MTHLSNVSFKPRTNCHLASGGFHFIKPQNHTDTMTRSDQSLCLQEFNVQHGASITYNGELLQAVKTFVRFGAHLALVATMIMIFASQKTAMMHHLFFLPLPAAFRILVPQPGIEPRPPAAKVLSPNNWTTRKFMKTKF